MRVALLSGGRDKPYALGLTSALTAQGIQVDFIGGDEFDVPALTGNRHVRFLNLRGDQETTTLTRRAVRLLRYYGRLLRYAATAEPAILHILWNNYWEVFDRTALMLYYRWLGKRLALTAHNVNAGRRDGTDGWVNRLSLRMQYRLSDHIFVHTARMRQELIDEFHVPPAHITVIPFGVNNTLPLTALTTAAAKRRLGLAAHHRALLFFGNIAPYKGVEYLVSAFAAIARRCADYTLIIAGMPKGPAHYWAGIARDILDNGLTDRIVAHIRYIPDEETELYFKAADVLVLPYSTIFQSGVLVLGYSFGLPAIVADVGSLRDDVVEGENGLVFKPGDVRSLETTIESYFDSELYRQLEARRPLIRRAANERHSWDRVGELTCRAYAGLQPSGQVGLWSK